MAKRIRSTFFMIFMDVAIINVEIEEMDANIDFLIIRYVLLGNLSIHSIRGKTYMSR